MQRRTIQFRIRIPPIQLGHWVPTAKDAIAFPYRRENVAGTVFLNLDDEAVEWDDFPVDPAGDECESVPVTCERIVVRIAGEYGDEFDEREFLAAAHNVAITYLIRFVSYVKLELGQYWVDVGRIPELGLLDFIGQTEAKWISENGETDVLIRPGGWPKGTKLIGPHKPLFHYSADSLDKTSWDTLKQSIDKMAEPNLTKRLIAEARRHLEDGDYSMAAVEAITALESRLEGFIKRRCNKKGISNTQFEESHKLYIADYLKLLLPLVLDEQELEEWIPDRPERHCNARLAILEGKSVIKQCIDLNRKRNDVVHKGATLSLEDVELGIDTVGWLLEFIEQADDSESRPNEP